MTRVPTGDPWFFRLKRTRDFPKPFAATMKVCGNPCCPCTEVSVLFQEVDPDTLTLAGRRHSINIDLSERKLVADGSEAASSEELRFGRSYVAEIEEEEWERLWKVFTATKLRTVEEADPQKIGFSFDVEEIETDGLLVAYPGVFPFSDQFRFTAGPDEYLVMDHYCVRRKCTCTNANLELLSLPTKQGEKPSPAGPVLYNYESGTWEPYDTRTSRQELERLVEGLLAAHPTLSGTLRKRHGFLRKAYAAFRRSRAKVVSSRSPERVGRNAPCPCGSGKKYKHCCGR